MALGLTIKEITGDAECYKFYANMCMKYIADLKSKDTRVVDFDIAYFYHYFQLKNCRHYFLYLGEFPIGFIAVVQGTKKRYHIATAYIDKSYRNNGYGGWMAKQIRDRYEGIATLDVLCNNPRAEEFWRRIYIDYDEECEIDDERFVFQKKYKKGGTQKCI